jgi:hypothetical protein
MDKASAARLLQQERSQDRVPPESPREKNIAIVILHAFLAISCLCANKTHGFQRSVFPTGLTASCSQCLFSSVATVCLLEADLLAGRTSQ